MGLKQTQSVQLNLYTSPKMRQAFQILTLPVDELSNYLLEELDQNPIFDFLEDTGANLPQEKYAELDLTEDNYHHIEEIVFEEIPEVPRRDFEFVYKETSYEELMKEFKEYTQDPQVIAEGEEIIGNLDKRGLLKEKHKKTEALRIAHEIGVGFSSLQEMFLYQLKDKKTTKTYTLIKHHWDSLLNEKLSEQERELLIHDLTCPLLVDQKEHDPPIPVCDIEIDENNSVRINEDLLPKFTLNLSYYNNPEMKRQVAEANWIIKNLTVRNHYLRKLGELLVHRQPPLNVQETAEHLGIHPSTLYRAIKNKHISTPEGIFPLSRFFKKQKPLQDRLVELIAAEKKPWTDDQLVKKLVEEGYKVARRTVAHYRKLLSIGSSRKR